MWRFSTGETTLALVIAVVSLWSAFFVAARTYEPVLGGDFMVFYPFGTAARLGKWSLQYDWTAFHQLQVALIPSSESFWYPPAYPPIVAAIFAPFAYLPFEMGYAMWVTATMCTYAALMNVVAANANSLRRAHIILASLLFPPFVLHELQGQTTIVPLIGFIGGWWGLKQSRPLLAGCLLSLVAVKPHLGMALAAVLPLMGLWRTIGGIVLGGAAQAFLTFAICGPGATTAYITTTLRVLRDPSLIEPDPASGHALRMSLDAMAPGHVASIGWLLASAAVIWLTVRTWRVHHDWRLRISTLLLSTLLVSPHVQAYDAILLAPATFWLGEWALASRQRPTLLGLVALSALFVAPWARIWTIPLTLPVLVWLLWRCQRQPLLQSQFVPG
jgi:hypothetical protein